MDAMPFRTVLYYGKGGARIPPKGDISWAWGGSFSATEAHARITYIIGGLRLPQDRRRIALKILPDPMVRSSVRILQKVFSKRNFFWQ